MWVSNGSRARARPSGPTSKIGSTAEASSSSHWPGERLLIIVTSSSGGAANRGGSRPLRRRHPGRSEPLAQLRPVPGNRHPEAAVDGDEREAAVGMLRCEGRCDRTAPRMADHDRTRKRQRIQRRCEVGGDRAQVVWLLGSLRVAVTALIEREDRAAGRAGCEPPGDRVPEPPLRGETVQEDDRGPGPRPPGRRQAHLDAGHGEVDAARGRGSDAERPAPLPVRDLSGQRARPVVVCTISTSQAARWLMLAGTEPRRRPARLLSPRLPTMHKSALRSSMACTSTSTGSPALQNVSMVPAPAFFARSAASRRMSSAGCEPTTLYASSPSAEEARSRSRPLISVYADTISSVAPVSAATAAARSTARNDDSEPSVPTRMVL